MELIGEGAEAKIYSTELYGNEVIVKYRNEKAYRVQALDLKIRKTRTRKEANIIARSIQHGIPAPGLFAIGEFSIYMEKKRGKLLKDIKITKVHMAKTGRALAKLHNSGITHGDFTPANIIAESDEICIIDFGLSEMTYSSEERALDILLMKRQLDEALYKEFISAYSGSADSSKETLSRLEEIERRGRYQTRTLM